MPPATWQPVTAQPDEPLAGAGGHADALAAEAARYAVLRRMGSAIRHQIAGALQPVGMLASMLERRVQAPQPNVEALRKNTGEMSRLARTASAECVALMGWFAPPAEDVRVPISQGADECIHLLATELSFRGFTLVSTWDAGDASVDRTALRMLLPAALMAFTDNAAVTGEVRLQAHVQGDAVRLTLVLVPGADGHTPVPAKAYRPLGWDDVHALALDSGVGLQVDLGGASLVFPAGPHLPAAQAQAAWH